MAWDEDYEDGYLLDEEDEIALMEVDREGEFFPGGLRDELDYELYEEEKEEADPDDFPESFEEWKIQKEQERWEAHEQEVLERELMEYEE